MASETFKKMAITHLNTQYDGEMAVCSFDGCDSKASNKLVCGNTIKYACDEHLAAVKTTLSASSVDEDERVCSQGGPNDLNKTLQTHPAV